MAGAPRVGPLISSGLGATPATSCASRAGRRQIAANPERMQFAGFDHIDLRVADLAAEVPLYDALLPALGLTEVVESPDAREYYEPVEPGEARRFFGINVDSDHRANATRICFAAASPSEVDRLAQIALAAGARAMEGPEIPYSSEKYYAVFFEDGSGNKLEIAYRRPHLVQVAQLHDDEAAESVNA